MTFLPPAVVIAATKENTTTIPEFVGGLNLGKVKQCVSAVQAHCVTERLPSGYFSCIHRNMQAHHECQQSLVFYQKTKGIIDKIKHYDNVDVIYATVLASGHSGGFYMIDSKGELIEPIARLDIRSAEGYAAIAKHYPNVTLWPIVIDFPDNVSDQNGNRQIIFEQLLMNGCFACERAGVAMIAYRFTPNGAYLGRHLVRLVARE